MAYRKGYKFHGNHYNTPGVYSYVESNMQNIKMDGAKNIAIIGTAKGGKPHEIMFIDDAEIAKEVVKGGDLLTGMLKAYDPVTSTKTGVELGGADLIMAIRSNNAKKAKTSVYQSREVSAKIGEVVVTKHPTTTGKITTSGTFTGTTNKTIKVVITSEGTKDLSEATYKFAPVGGDFGAVDFPLNETTNATNKDVGDGVLISFTDGKYTKGDTFLIPCTAPVTLSEFVYNIESKDYGEECNLISHKLEDGSREGTKMLTIHNAKNDRYEVFENVGGTFDIQYTGDQKYAAITITSDGQGNSIKLQTYIGATETDAIIDLDLDLDDTEFRSVKQLARHISSFENYSIETASIINGDLTVNDLDFVVKQDIKTKPFHITAVLRDLQKTAEFQSRYVDISIINREVNNYEDYDFTPLTGGSEGVEPRSYVKFLDQLAKYDIDYIVPLTDDLTLIAECREHCIEMSERKGKERRLVCGLGNGLSVLQAVNTARRIARDRVQYFGTGFYDFDQKLYPAYIAAAMHAGRAAFLGVESATADVYNILKPEKTFEGIDRRELIDNGVMFFDEIVSDVNHKHFYSKLVWDYTTYTEVDDPLRVERSTGAIADQLSKRVRKDLDKILTGKLTPVAVLETARNKVLSILKEYIARGIILEYRNVSVKKVRDRTDIKFEVAPAQVNNFTMVDILFYSKDIDLGTIEN